jgi:hypothetical protein
MKQELIHIKEAAKMLGVTRQAVYKKLTALGKKPQKVGNKAFIDAATLQEIKDGKKLQPPVSDGDNTATKQVDNELVNLLKQQVEGLQQDKVAAQSQVDNLQRQLEIKDRQIDDLSTGGREMRLLLGSAQKQIGLLTAPAPIDVDEPSPPDHNQPEKPSKKKKKRKKKKR